MRNGPINKSWLMRRYLIGIDITDDTRTQFHDGLWDLASENSFDYVGKALGIDILDEGVITERQDFSPDEGDWRLITLDRRPVTAVTKLEFVMGGTPNPAPVLEVPPEWIYLANKEQAQIQVVPTANTGGAAFVQGVVGVGLWLGGAAPIGSGQIPGFYRATYRAGWYGGVRVDLPVSQLVWTPASDDDIRPSTVSVELNQRSAANTTFTVVGVDDATGSPRTETVTLGPTKTLERTRTRWRTITSVTLATPGTIGIDSNRAPVGVSEWTVQVDHHIPATIMHVAGMWASMWCLNTAGDLIVGAGVASKSTGVDGLSQSVSTTSSATNAGYGSRIIQYKKDIGMAMRALESTYARSWV